MKRVTCTRTFLVFYVGAVVRCVLPRIVIVTTRNATDILVTNFNPSRRFKTILSGGSNFRSDHCLHKRDFSKFANLVLLPEWMRKPIISW